MTHHALDELKRVFGVVQVHHYWLGIIFLAIVAKNMGAGRSEE
jgi:hypothetical protein